MLFRSAELIFRRIGITFAVYGEADAQERLIPFDVIPRIMRGRDPRLQGAIRLNQPSLTEGGAHPQSAVIRRVMGKPAVIAAVAVGPVDGIPQSVDGDAPIIMSVKFIDEAALASIGTQLRLVNLRKIDQIPVPQGDFNYDLTGPDGNVIARFAWTPKQPGAEIVQNVVPFVAVALTGFALLAAFVLRYMSSSLSAGSPKNLAPPWFSSTRSWRCTEPTVAVATLPYFAPTSFAFLDR